MGFEQRGRGWVSVPQGLTIPHTIGGLWAVRHGQSEANVWFADPTTNIRHMRTTDADVELTDVGRWEARKLGQWLAGLGSVQRPDLVVCSPYLRTRLTWALMAATATERNRHLRPIRTVVDERIRDREMGIFDLFPQPAIRRASPSEAARRERLGDWWYRPPGGESIADVAMRVRSFLTELDAVAPGEQVLLVTHDAVLSALRYVIDGFGATPDLVSVPTASVSQWRREGNRLALRVWGSADHLAEGKDADFVEAAG
ncbi:histidine phosphatase family protein [Nocardia camponoti]|uniref:Phosphoglycerate mutase n=1 Tax=Nocardia camponoti TaxID=1616106 RepID=A0A917Q8Z5_9NOCA|nr:histidine phosphatase family protein [Nocardia camponoti]GGK36508.1 phosphoglycerate mutase [Nocardia camponoti]